MSDVGLDEVQVFVSVVVLFLQCADSITLRTDKQVTEISLKVCQQMGKKKEKNQRLSTMYRTLK